MLRILIVEDDFIIADDLKHTVTKLGHQCVGTAATGHDAVAKARELSPDILLMDIRLRGSLTGAAAADQIRAERPVPIVFLSAFTPALEGQRGVALVPKPFSLDQLRRAIEVALADMSPTS